MAADPNSFDYFRMGSPFVGIKAGVDNRSFDYFRVGEPQRPMAPVVAAAVTTPPRQVITVI